MSSNESNGEIFRDLDRKTKTDYLVLATKIGVSTIPVVGGILTELITDFIPNSKEKKLIDFIAQFGLDLDKVKERINKDTIKTDEFAYLFEQTLRSVNENYQQEKLDAFRALLVNSLVRTDTNAEQNKLYLNIIRRLEVTHLKVLAMFSNPEDYIRKNNLAFTMEEQTTIKQILKELFPSYDPLQIQFVIRDLSQIGLLTFPSFTALSVRSFAIKNRLNELGKSLTSFIILN